MVEVATAEWTYYVPLERSLSFLTVLARTTSGCQRDYILPLWFFLSFFRRLISELTERISTKLGHIFTYACYLKNLARSPPGINPQGRMRQNPLFGPTSNFDRAYLCNGTWYQQSVKKLVNLQRVPYMPPNLMNLWSGNGWERLARFFNPPLNICIGRHLLPHGPYINRQQANVGTCYVVARAYSLEQQNARRAYAGLCHSSSSFDSVV